MLIRNYGLFWERDAVDWFPGRGGSFALVGRHKKNLPNLRVADFRDQRGIYILYGDYGPHYVGLIQDRGLGDRLKDHLSDKHRRDWKRFSWFGFRRVLQKRDEYHIKQLGELPRWNWVGIAQSISDTEALLIKAMGLSNIREMNFTDEEKWEQVSSDQVENYIKKLNH